MMGDVFKTSSNHRPGEPLREWDLSDEFAAVDLRLQLQSTGSSDALGRLVRSHPLSSEDIFALAQLNSLSVSQWREPPTAMIKGQVYVDPAVAELFNKYEATD